MGGVQNTCGDSGGVGGGSLLWSKNGNSREEGGSYVKFPPWWGYGYFLEPHIQGNFGLFCSFSSKLPRIHVDYIVMQMRKISREKGYGKRCLWLSHTFVNEPCSWPVKWMLLNSSCRAVHPKVYKCVWFQKRLANVQYHSELSEPKMRVLNEPLTR